MIFITTSRRPSRRTRSLCKDLVRVIPGSIYKPRGKKSIEDVAFISLRILGFPYALILDTIKGNPGLIKFIKCSLEGFSYQYPFFRIRGVKLMREHNINVRKFDNVVDNIILMVTDEKVYENFNDVILLFSKIFQRSPLTGVDVTKLIDERTSLMIFSERLVEVNGKKTPHLMISFKIGEENTGPRIWGFPVRRKSLE
ncbi:hypothetical protein DRO02_00090 [archaeon]|nr:MAG: hypothetical protein DRN89_03845 [archaeon]RLG65802.1 MAG: hypothetical protein DRO21_00945 [archaeon]RLG66077.1 MAG: hypothetical protein DRO02_00090 [archaeon]